MTGLRAPPTPFFCHKPNLQISGVAAPVCARTVKDPGKGGACLAKKITLDAHGADGAVGCVHLPRAGQLYGNYQSGLFFYNHGQNLWVPAGDWLKDRISIPVEQAVSLAVAV